MKIIAWTCLCAAILMTIGCHAPSVRQEDTPKPRSEARGDTSPEPAGESERTPQPAPRTDLDPVDAESPDSSRLPTIDEDEGASRVLSNDGAYLITYASEPETLPLNEPFSIVVRLYRPETGERIEDSALRIEADADMPAHRHGMVRVPQITKTGPGEFRVDGMMMHMPGYWQLYVDVIRDGITERAQFDIDLD